MPICRGQPKHSYLLQETGGKIELEDGSGYLLLEDQDIGQTSSPWKSKGSMFIALMIADFLKGFMDGT